MLLLMDAVGCIQRRTAQLAGALTTTNSDWLASAHKTVLAYAEPMQGNLNTSLLMRCLLVTAAHCCSEVRYDAMSWCSYAGHSMSAQHSTAQRSTAQHSTEQNRTTQQSDGRLTASAACQALDSFLHVRNPIGISTQPHQLLGGRAKSAQGCKQVDDDAGVIAHGAQHVGSAQHIVHRPQVVAKEWTNDKHNRSCGAQVLQQKVLHTPLPVCMWRLVCAWHVDQVVPLCKHRVPSTQFLGWTELWLQEECTDKELVVTSHKLYA